MNPRMDAATLARIQERRDRCKDAAYLVRRHRDEATPKTYAEVHNEYFPGDHPPPPKYHPFNHCHI